MRGLKWCDPHGSVVANGETCIKYEAYTVVREKMGPCDPADDDLKIARSIEHSTGWCDHCQKVVDNRDSKHRVVGLRAECVLRGDIPSELAAPLSASRYQTGEYCSPGCHRE